MAGCNELTSHPLRSYASPPFLFAFLFDACALLLVVFLLVLACQGEGFLLGSRYLAKVIYFTLFQAAASAFLTVLLSLLLISTFRKFTHPAMSRLCQYLHAIPFFVPALIGCLCLVLLLGQNGLLAQAASLLHLSFDSFLYGTAGILLCHLFFYVPFILAHFSRSLQNSAQEYERLSEALSLGDWGRFRLLYLPLLKKEIAPAFVLIFLYCLRSFTIILIFGGSPGTTTLEIALFQTLNFELNWSLGAQISLFQLLINAPLFFFIRGEKSPFLVLPSNETSYRRQTSFAPHDYFLIVLSLLFFLLPLALLLCKGVISSSFLQVVLHAKFWIALGTSLLIASLTALFSLLFLSFFVYNVYAAHQRGQHRLLPFVSEIPAHLSLIFSPLVLGGALFIFFSHKFNHPCSLILILSLMNALCFLPNLYFVLSNPYVTQRMRFDPLCTALELRGWTRFFRIDWDFLKPSIGYALSICFIFSLGDARTILFFNQNHFPTLITLIYQEMVRYHFADATALSAWLVLISLFLFFLFQKIFGRHYDLKP